MKLPDGWKEQRLKKLLTVPIQNGYSPNCSDEPTGKWILGLGTLTDNGFDPSQAKHAPTNDTKVESFLLGKGDFLISRSNTLDKVGRSALFRGEIENCSYPDLMMRFRINENTIVNEYLEAYLKGNRAVKYFQSHASGTSGSMVKINKTVVENLSVIYPPLSEQKAIADLLSVWDEAIEKIEKLIRVKEEHFNWLMRQLISEPRNSSNSKQWKRVKLEDVCKIQKGQQLNVEHMIEDGEYYVLNGGIAPSGRTDGWNTKADTITISEGGNSCGYVNYNTEQFWSGGHCYSLLGLVKDVNKHYLYFYLKMNEPILMKLRVGSGLPNIQKKDLEKFILLIPPMTEQEHIAATLSIAQQEIELLKEISVKYKTQKRGLMQKMLTGQWRVKALKTGVNNG